MKPKTPISSSLLSSTLDVVEVSRAFRKNIHFFTKKIVFVASKCATVDSHAILTTTNTTKTHSLVFSAEFQQLQSPAKIKFNTALRTPSSNCNHVSTVFAPFVNGLCKYFSIRSPNDGIQAIDNFRDFKNVCLW
mgnify:CR=1 FL=1